MDWTQGRDGFNPTRLRLAQVTQNGVGRIEFQAARGDQLAAWFTPALLTSCQR